MNFFKLIADTLALARVFYLVLLQTLNMHKPFLWLLLLPTLSQAQLPAVDIYLSEIFWADKTMQFSAPVNITQRPGYDNQPSFAVDGKAVYYTSIRENDQADIYMYDIAAQSTKQITKTSTSEYSPVWQLGKGLTVVMVEPDSAQRLWLFRADGSHVPLLDKVDSIGYYALVDEKYVAFFKVTDIPTLVIADLKKQKEHAVDVNVGRCIKQIPFSNAFSYIVKSDSINTIYQMDPKTHARSIITTCPAGYEDYVWCNNSVILMARENGIYAYNLFSANPDWVKVAEFPALAGKQIFRLALSWDNTKLAFVATE